VQRLFSTFPNSWPGLGLLILRLATCFALYATAQTLGHTDRTHLFVQALIAFEIVLLLVGLWTPLAAVLQAMFQAVVLILGHQFNPAIIVAAALGVALALLGPGAWSVDARLFGRKIIV
jgi:putative oxidoreductase